MEYVILPVNYLTASEYVGAEPVQRATWLNLMYHCALQENGGTIERCRQWKDRQWQQTCGVTKEEAENQCDLYTYDGDNIIVWGYPKEDQEYCEKLRETARANGKRGGRPPKSPKQNLLTLSEERAISSVDRETQHPKIENPAPAKTKPSTPEPETQPVHFENPAPQNGKPSPVKNETQNAKPETQPVSFAKQIREEKRREDKIKEEEKKIERAPSSPVDPTPPPSPQPVPSPETGAHADSSTSPLPAPPDSLPPIPPQYRNIGRKLTMDEVAAILGPKPDRDNDDAYCDWMVNSNYLQTIADPPRVQPQKTPSNQQKGTQNDLLDAEAYQTALAPSATQRDYLTAINRLRPEWNYIQSLSPEEKDNLPTACRELKPLTLADWKALARYLRSDFTRDRSRFWSPNVRSAFLKHITDTLTLFRQWRNS